MTNEEFNESIKQIGEAYENAKENLNLLGIRDSQKDVYIAVYKELQKLRELACENAQQANVQWQRVQRLEKGGLNG